MAVTGAGGFAGAATGWRRILIAALCVSGMLLVSYRTVWRPFQLQSRLTAVSHPAIDVDRTSVLTAIGALLATAGPVLHISASNGAVSDAVLRQLCSSLNRPLFEVSIAGSVPLTRGRIAIPASAAAWNHNVIKLRSIAAARDWMRDSSLRFGVAFTELSLVAAPAARGAAVSNYSIALSEFERLSQVIVLRVSDASAGDAARKWRSCRADASAAACGWTDPLIAALAAFPYGYVCDWFHPPSQAGGESIIVSRTIDVSKLFTAAVATPTNADAAAAADSVLPNLLSVDSVFGSSPFASRRTQISFTHLSLLSAALMFTAGPILEMGLGALSTPLVATLSGSRYVLSAENDPALINRMASLTGSTHDLIRVDSGPPPATGSGTTPAAIARARISLSDEGWRPVGVTHRSYWSVILMSHQPHERRVADALRLADRADIIIVQNEARRIDPTRLCRRFQYCAIRDDTIAVSNSADIRSVFNFGPLPHDRIIDLTRPSEVVRVAPSPLALANGGSTRGGDAMDRDAGVDDGDELFDSDDSTAKESQLETGHTFFTGSEARRAQSARAPATASVRVYDKLPSGVFADWLSEGGVLLRTPIPTVHAVPRPVVVCSCNFARDRYGSTSLDSYAFLAPVIARIWNAIGFDVIFFTVVERALATHPAVLLVLKAIRETGATVFIESPPVVTYPTDVLAAAARFYVAQSPLFELLDSDFVMLVDADMIPLDPTYWRECAARTGDAGSPPPTPPGAFAGVISNADAYPPTPRAPLGTRRFPAHGVGMTVALWKQLFPYAAGDAGSATATSTSVLHETSRVLDTFRRGGGWAIDEDLLQRTLHAASKHADSAYPKQFWLRTRKDSNLQRFRRLDSCDLHDMDSAYRDSAPARTDKRFSFAARAAATAPRAVEEHFKRRPAWGDGWNEWKCLLHVIEHFKLFGEVTVSPGIEHLQSIQSYRAEYARIMSRQR